MTTNHITKVFDNIGFKFNIIDNKFIISDSIKNFAKLSNEHIGYHIPYLARNILNNEMETGVGEVRYNSIGDIVVERLQIVKSSNNNQPVNFNNSSSNEFYIFANQYLFDRMVDQLFVIDSDYKLEPVKGLYLVNCADKDINCALPSVSVSKNLIIEFKIIAKNYNLIIRNDKQSVVCNLDQSTYAKLVCDGNTWIVLKDSQQSIDHTMSALSSSDFTSLSVPEGDEQSLQYKNGSSFAGSQVYWDNANQNLLIGADNSIDANIVLPSSGNKSILFNQNKLNSDFIINGSGNRNLFFAYDGRLGINIPSGTRPSTIFHVVNTICQEGFRLENRNACHPANMTLFHKPSSTIPNNSVVGQINLSAKDSNGNRVDYAKIESRAMDPNAGSLKGGIDLSVASSTTGIKILSADTDSVSIGYSGVNVSINNNKISLTSNRSEISASDTSISLRSNGISLQGDNVTIGSGVSSVVMPGSLSVGPISASSLQSSNINLPNIAPSSLLTVNNNNRLVSSDKMSLNSLGTINLPIAPNKILNTTTNGAITGIYSLDDYFLTEKDIVWNKYSPRSGSVCLRQVTFDNPVPIEEFAVGDQVVLTSYNGNFYRKITGLDLNGSQITGLVLDQTVTQTTTVNFTVLSISQGGYLSMGKNVDNGIISDSTQNTLSIRPLVDTVFNTKQKDINFSVYGLDDNPALYIKANTGRLSFQSGMYSSFSTNNNTVFPIVVTTGGAGISNLYSSANFDYNPSVNLFSGILSDVGTNGAGSYYGTFDQNGNAAEWVEKPNTIESRDKDEFVCGGSYLTPSSGTGGIGASGLKSIESLPRQSGFEYVGFRIASLYNTIDSLSVVHPTGLNMSFVSVIDPKNLEDTSTTYLKTGNQYSSVVINNLGVVNNTYRIGKYEITNDQYCKFLNTVAKNNDRGLYDTRMSTSVLGGIDRVLDGEYIYTVKQHMAAKPVLFVNYVSAIRFINWMHNGALSYIPEEEVDYIIDIGAYNIASIGNNSFNIVKSSYRKYWLPNLNEWHKAAYYKPVNTFALRGTSTVSIKRPDPFLVASGLDSQSQPSQLYANLSVSGWLYVDHIIVGDGTIRSAKRFTGLTEPSASGDSGSGQSITPTPSGTVSVPKVNLDTQWNNVNAIVSEDRVSCVIAGCEFNATPLRAENDVPALCDDPDLLANNNTPWWCQLNNTGPGWF